MRSVQWDQCLNLMKNLTVLATLIEMLKDYGFCIISLDRRKSDLIHSWLDYHI